MNQSNLNYPFYSFKGTQREIGQQFGEACSDLIKKNLELSLERLTSKMDVGSKKTLDEEVLKSRSSVCQYAPFYDEQIQGVAEGAGISLADAYFIQLRAEAYRYFEEMGDCTSFVVLPEATEDGVSLIGKNADLPGYATEVGVIMECKPNDSPSYLTVTLAGLVSYEGINELGMGVTANFLDTGGWRPGVPRYMFPGLALTQNSVEDAVRIIRNVHRASSRNIMILDSKVEKAVGMEVTPIRDALYQPNNGMLYHSNHFICEELLEEERSKGRFLTNSKARLNRMEQLMKENHGRINKDVMQAILSDREGVPDCICMNADGDNESVTFSSVIAIPSKREIWITSGPPNKNEYKRYALS